MRFFNSLIIFLFLSCTPLLTPEYYKEVNNKIFNGEYESARELIESSKELYGDKSSVLYHMDMGFSLHLEGDYKKSNQHLHKASELIRLLYTKSLTREAVSFLTSDNSLHYEGEDYEKVFIHIISALNYTYLGLYDDALVEARQVDLLISWLNTVRKNTAYKEDAFARYLSGIIYENSGEINDAHISYMKALRAYENYKNFYALEVPQQLINDVLRTAKILEFNNTIEEIKNKYPFLKIEDKQRDENKGEIVLIHYNGLIPQKVESYIEISLSKGIAMLQSTEIRSEDEKKVQSAMTIAKSIAFEENINIAFPKMEILYPLTSSSEISIINEIEYKKMSESVLNFSAIAMKLFDERMGRITGKTIARAVVKFLLARAAGEIGEKAGGETYGGLIGFLTETATRATLQAMERADIRGWHILPYEIRMARISLPEGTYNIKISYDNERYYDVFENVEVKKRKITFLKTRTQ